MEVKVGKKYRHFKGGIIEVIALAKHSETLEDMVVYTHDSKYWVRPLSMFFDTSFKEKYPNIDQEYRFVQIDD